MDVKIIFSPEAEKEIGRLSKRQIKILYSARPIKEDKKLFKEKYDTVKISLRNKSTALVEFSLSGKPGFLKKQFQTSFVRAVNNSWINSPILNRSGLAAMIWDDNIPNKLRRRLEQRVQFDSFRVEEKERIIEETEKFLNMVKKSLTI